MLMKLKNFWSTENGAVTVDWVVLCAAVVGLCVAMVANMQTSTVELADSVVVNVTPGGF